MFEIVFVIAFVFVIYWRTFKYSLIVDDVRQYERIKEGLFNRGSWLNRIRHRLYGGGTFIGLFGYNFSKNGKIKTTVDHVFQTSLHALICVLIYLAFGSNQTSFCAALLYACNPANNQTSIWLNGRRYALNIILVLSMLMIGPLGLVLYSLTGFLQVSAVFAPIMFGPIAALIIPALVFVFRKDIVQKMNDRLSSIRNDDHKGFKPKKIIPIIKTYGAYCLKMVFPGRTLMVYPHLFYWGMTEKGNKDAYSINKDFAIGVLCLSLSALALLTLKGQMFWLFLFMVLSTLQWCGFISITQNFADRYISLPNVFMMFFLSHFIHQLAGVYALPILTAFLAYYLTNLNITMRMFKDMKAFWDYHLYFDPAGPKIIEFKTSFLIKTKDVLAAWETVKNGLNLNPNDFKLNLLAANCMHLMDDKPGVVHYLRQSKKHCYIGQENILKEVRNNLLGIDLESEINLIEQKKSKLDRRARENVQRVYEALQAA